MIYMHASDHYIYMGYIVYIYKKIVYIYMGVPSSRIAIVYTFDVFHHQMGPTPEPGRKTDFWTLLHDEFW